MNYLNCSIHGDNGNPDCKECWEKLFDFCDKNNVYISKDNNDLI